MVEEFKFGQSFPKLVEVPWAHGTEIRVVQLKPIAPMNTTHYTRDVVKQLGARYRRFLLTDAPKMKLSLHLLDGDDGDKHIQDYSVEGIRPVYFHPNTRLNKPVIERKKFSGKGWEVELTFGYAPDEKEIKELGLEKPTKFDPYNVSLKNQGLDLILHDRVISFHFLSEIGLVDARHPKHNLIRGEIDLKKGFSTAITKNAVIQDERFQECLQAVSEHLQSGGYLERRTYPDELPEKVLRDRLAEWLRTNKLAPKKDVKTEYAVEGFGGSIDVLADGEAWELKREEADGLERFQCACSRGNWCSWPCFSNFWHQFGHGFI